MVPHPKLYLLGENKYTVVTYLKSTVTVEMGELLSTDAITSLFASTAVFTSVLRDKF